ncbi:major facilitator superfamily domain-containing protein [Fimicolochytrium jonesii]|uniref:major facilitator superfamily domain-containing protein n=1 Tax=Fimicolochytrium jonesii TaxID=1396493 RepID=UPI0022FEA1C6|nr:major facilitator superfamily domain-containing protein [Fimicolochytrium jonesii]KAI8815747.1 major facilitator superfamily domain-containing protein [Fimicolochytrium jonesii]
MSTPKPSLYIIPKVLMFSLYIIQCSAPTYLSLIYQDRIGLPSTMIGIISAIPPFVAIIAGPSLSLIADITGQPKVLLAVAIVATSATLWLFVLLPLTFGTACVVAVLYAVTSAPIGSMMDVIALNMLGEHTILYGQQRVWGSIACGVTSFVGGMIVQKTGTINSMFVFHSITASIFLVLLIGVSQPWKRHGSHEKDDTKLDDGPVKPRNIAKSAAVEEDLDGTLEELRDMPGPIGGPNAAALGRSRSRRLSIVDAARRASRQGSIAASLGVTSVAEAAAAAAASAADESANGPSFGWLLAPDVLAFFFSNTLLGGVMSVIGSFLWIFLTNELDASATIRGMTGTAQVVLQLPFFIFAKQVLQKVGIRRSIIIANAVTVFRFLGYTILKKGPMANLVLGIELIHGLAFSLNWTASVAYAATVAPPGMEFLAQGILGAFYGGLGSGLGGLIGGFVYASFGSKILFFGCAGVTGVSLLVYVLVPMRKLKPEREDNVPPNERIMDRRGSQRLMEMEAGVGRRPSAAAAHAAAAAAAAGSVRPSLDTADSLYVDYASVADRRPSAVAIAVANLGRMNSMINV